MILTMRKRVPLPEKLTHWIASAMPEVGEIGRVRFYCCDRLPFVGERYSGFTLFRAIYLRESFFPIDVSDYGTVELIFHELVHVAQFRRSPLLFPLGYLIRLATHGYWDHPAECEARERARVLAEQYAADCL
jgi:hypothetical protein